MPQNQMVLCCRHKLKKGKHRHFLFSNLSNSHLSNSHVICLLIGCVDLMLFLEAANEPSSAIANAESQGVGEEEEAEEIEDFTNVPLPE